MRLLLTLLISSVLSLNYAQITGLSGSAISGTSSSLSWTDGGADPFGPITDYWVYMGSSAGAQNYANSGALGPGLSSYTETAGTFPTTGPGSVIYARLWHKHADYSGISVWRYTDTTFLSIPGPATPGTKPTIVSPTPGGAVPTGGFTLTWTPGAYSLFWIYLGTFAGSNNLLNTGQLASGTTSFAIPGTSYSAGTIWVRLWYKSGSTWKYIQTSYTATTIPPSTLTSYETTFPTVFMGSPVVSSIMVPDSGTITDVRVLIDMEASFISALNVSLISPGGSSVVLFDMPFPQEPSYSFVSAIFDDGSVLSVLIAPTIGGTFNSLSGTLDTAFDLDTSSGVWSLFIVDAYLPGDSGTINYWAISFNGDTSLGF